MSHQSEISWAPAFDAVRTLCTLPDGTFQARYASPREHLRHMETPAALILDEVEAEFVSDGDITAL